MEILLWIFLGLMMALFVNLAEKKRINKEWISTAFLSALGAVLGGFLSNLVIYSSSTGINILSALFASLIAFILLIAPKISHRI